MRRFSEIIEDCRRRLNPGMKLDVSDAMYAALGELTVPETHGNRYDRLAVKGPKREPTATEMLDALPGNIAAKAVGEELRRTIDREHARCSNIAGAAMREAKERHRSAIERMMPGATKDEVSEMIEYAAIGEVFSAD